MKLSAQEKIRLTELLAGIGAVKTQKQLALPTKFLFDDFYHANKENYEMIHDLSNQQANNFIRMFGFGPIQKTLKNKYIQK